MEWLASDFVFGFVMGACSIAVVFGLLHLIHGLIDYYRDP